jgi:hypothetical protein
MQIKELKMNFYSSLLVISILLSLSKAQARYHDGYLATVIGHDSDGTSEQFKSHDCLSAKWAEDDAMRICLKSSLPSCQLVETKRIYCNPNTQKCIC